MPIPDQIESRVSVLESEMHNLKDQVGELKQSSAAMREVLYDIKARQELHTSLLTKLEQISDKVDALATRLGEAEKEQLKLTFGQKALAGTIGLAGGGVGLAVTKFLAQFLS